MTPDLVHALTISGSILIGVVVLIIIVSFVTVRRGEVEMAQGSKERHAGRH
jgi:hypothetical protein